MTPLQRIKSRCRVDSITGCWIWTGATSKSNGGTTVQPRIHCEDYTRDASGKTKTVQSGNHAAWHAFTGKPIPAGHRVFKTACCTDGMCVNPAHLQCGTTTEWGSSLTSKGIWKGQATRIRANRAIGRTRSHVTPAMAAEILKSNETGLQLAARLQIGDSVVSRVRRGQLPSIHQINNPFAGLMS